MGGGPRPSYDHPPLMEQQPALPADKPAMIGEALAANWLGPAACTHGMEPRDALGGTDAAYGRRGQDDRRPVLMSLEKTPEPRPLGQAGQQRPIVAR